MSSQNVSRGNLSISGKTFISTTLLDNSLNGIAVIGNGGEVNLRDVNTINNTFLTGGSYNCTTSTLTLNNSGGSVFGEPIGPYLSFSGSGFVVGVTFMGSDGTLYAGGGFSGFENSLDLNNPQNPNPYLWGDLSGVAILDSNQVLSQSFKTNLNYDINVNEIGVDSSKNIYILHLGMDTMSGISTPMYWSVINDDGSINTSVDFQSHVLLGLNDIIQNPNRLFVTNNDKIILVGPFSKYSGNSVTDINNIIGLNPDGSIYGNFHQLNITNQNPTNVEFSGMQFYEDIDDGYLYFSSNQIQISGVSEDTLLLFRTDVNGNFENTFSPFVGQSLASSLAATTKIKVIGDYIYVSGHFTKLNDTVISQDFGGINHTVSLIRIDKNTGVWDSNFLVYFAETTFNVDSDIGAVYDFHIFNDNSILLIGSFDHYSGTSLSSYGIVKLNPDLTINSNTNFGNGFYGAAPGVTNPRPNSIHVTPDNNILITGSFSGYSGDDRWVNIVKINNNSQSIDIPFNICNTFTGGTSSGTTITIEGGCCEDIVITGVTGVYVTGSTSSYTGVTLTRNDNVNVLIDSEQTIRTKYTGVTVGTTTLVTIPVSQFFGTHIEYAVTNGAGVRTGILIGSFEGGTKVEMSDVCTADTTDFSSDFEFDITVSGEVQSIVTSGTYTIVFNTRAIEI